MKALLRRAPEPFESGFAALRRELNVPNRFPSSVLDEAAAATPDQTDRIDALDLPLIAVDPPGATDLDQAFHAARVGDGYRVFYAIADVGTFLRPGGAIDTEARKRGTTLYSPDLRTPLHPPVISEDRASLLPGGNRPALLWTIDLDAAGAPTRSRLERATVKIREAISYQVAQTRAEQGDEAMGLLKSIGQLRQQQEASRGGVSLNLPSQEVVEHDGTYTLVYEESLPIENWNAQISLLTGIVAGTTMGEAGIGVLRTLPATQEQDLRQLRYQAKCLGVDWPDHVAYPDLVRDLTPDTPAKNAFLLQAARAFRGAGYVSFNGTLPAHHEHGAIASIYGHVTAPLRRLIDRFGNEILLAIHADTEPPTWAVEALDELPSLMGQARSRESALERATLDFTEAMLLEQSLGMEFDGFVVDLNKRRDRARVQIAEPAIVTNIDASGRALAETLRLRLDSADPASRTISFGVVE